MVRLSFSYSKYGNDYPTSEKLSNNSAIEAIEKQSNSNREKETPPHIEGLWLNS